MNWDDLHHFAALAEAGSLSAAARLLGVEHATVARRIAALEASLGVVLADRRGRRWALTAEGERIAAIARRMNHEAQAAKRSAEGARAELAGTVTISAPPALAAARLAQPLVALQQRHPELAIRILGEARTASLAHSEADIALRMTRPEHGDLTLLKLGDIHFRLYASPSYLAAVREADWRFVGSGGELGQSPQQQALQAYAADRPFAFHANSVELQLAAARAGAGIAALPDFMAQGHPGLALIARDQPLASRDLWLVVHTDLKRAAPVRAVMEAIRKAWDRPHRPSDRLDRGNSY
ncbi:MAG TPA: LysR family transcriptional regulator [Bordetella sp.]